MLRFDIPAVCSNAYRFQAVLTFMVAGLYLFTPYRWVAFLLAYAGLMRGFVNPHRCLTYKLFAGLTKRFNWSKRVNAGAKMFADKLTGLAGLVMGVSWLLGSELGVIPAGALLLFSFFDLATGFCAACWAYGAWYKLRSA